MSLSKKQLLAGSHEAADILGVSSARVHQLSVSDPKFPEPVDIIRATPVYWQADLVQYAQARNTKNGRPFAKS